MGRAPSLGKCVMSTPRSTMAREIALAACDFEEDRTGHRPKSATVVLCENTLVVTLQGTLSPAEEAMTRNPKCAAQLRRFHRRLFASASGSLQREIARITGAEVREANTDIVPTGGQVPGTIAGGTTVQWYLLAHPVPPDSWSGVIPDGSPDHTEALPC